MNLVKATSKVFLARVLSTVAMFVAITYFARELGATLLGMYFLFEALLTMTALISDFGVKGAVEKRLSEGKNPGNVLGSGLAMKFTISSVVIGLVFIAGSYIDAYVGTNVVGLLIVAIVLQQLSDLTIKILNGEQRVGETAIIELSHRVVWVFVGTLLVIQSYGVYALIYAKIIALLIMFLIGAYRCSTPIGRPTISHARSLFDYAKFEVISGTGDRMFNWFDILVIGFFFAQNYVGAYEIAWQVAAITVLFSMAIRQSIFPVISSLSSEGNLRQIENLVARTTTLSLFIVIPAFFGAVTLSSEILGVIFGAEYEIASLALVILMLYQISYAVNVTTGRTLQAIKHPDEAAYSMIAGLITNVLLNVMLIPFFGINGAAVATMTSYTVMLGFRIYYLSSHINLYFEYKQIGWFILSAIVMTVVLVSIKQFIALTSIPAVLAIVVFGAIVYFALSLLSTTFRQTVIAGSQKFIG